MINTIKQITIDSFQKDGYLSFLKANKKKVFGALSLFMLIQFLVVILIPSILFIPEMKEGWKDIKNEVATYIRKEDFSYIGTDGEFLITDLAEQPYIKTETNSSDSYIFAIDSTGELTETAIIGKEGVIFLKDRMIFQSNSDYESYTYSELTEEQALTTTKTEMISFIEGQKIENGIKKFIASPEAIITIIVICFIVLIVLAAISIWNIAFWALFTGGVAYVILKAEHLKRFNSAFKLGLLTYIGTWYVRILISYFSTTEVDSAIKWISFGVSIFVIYSVLVLPELSQEKKKAELKN